MASGTNPDAGAAGVVQRTGILEAEEQPASLSPSEEEDLVRVEKMAIVNRAKKSGCINLYQKSAKNNFISAMNILKH